MAEQSGLGSLALSAKIVSAYLTNHAVDPESLPGLIRDVRAAIAGLGAAAEPVPAPRPEPAVPIRRSVFPDHIVCLEDGKRLKTLKRHLASAYGLTPDAYRARWGLPSTYPMVAPDYASARSALARRIGLGRRGRPDS